MARCWRRAHQVPLLVWSAAFATDARAWDVTEVQGEVNTYAPVGVSLRQWGPTRDVVLAYDFAEDDQASNDDAHELWIAHYTCTNASCSSATLQVEEEIGDPTRFDALRLPSMAIHYDAVDGIELDIVHRQKLDTDCDNDNVSYYDLASSEFTDLDAWAHDLMEVVWNETDHMAGAEMNQVALTPQGGVCHDHGVSTTRWVDGAPMACYSEKVDDAANDFLECASNPDNGGDWTLDDTFDNDDLNLDHPWLDVRDGERFVAARWGRDRGLDDELRVFLPDLAGDPVQVFPALIEDVDYPSIDITDGGDVRVVWEDKDRDDRTTSTIQYSACLAADDCGDDTDWRINRAPPLNGNWNTNDPGQHTVNNDDGAMNDDVEDHAHPQIVAEGNKQFLLYQADIVLGQSDTRKRVFLTERCGTATWWGDPELVFAPSDPEDQVVIEFGRPNIALNRADNVVHVAFIVASADTSSVHWARRTYTECP